MKGNKRILALAAAFAAGLLLMTACSKIVPWSGPTEYAVVIYGTAGGQMDDTMEVIWEELRTVLPDKGVRVFCRYKYGDGGDQFTGQWGNPGEVVTFELDKDTRFQDLRGSGVQDQGFELFQPENLAQVLSWAWREALPTKGCVLVFFGHGGGFDASADFPKELYGTVAPATRGVVYDEWFQGRVGMNMYEVARAVELSHVGRLQGILFHNCLMGGIESLTEVAPYADYLIATPFLLTSENEPLIPYLVKSLPGNTFEAAARQALRDSKERLTDGYRHEDPAELPANVELLKSSELTEVCRVTKKLAERLCQLYPTEREAIDRATCKVYRFYNLDPYFDLLDYARILADETGDGQLRTIAAELEQAFGLSTMEQITIDFDTHPELSSYSLSVVLVDKETYEKTPTRGTFSYRQAYEYSTFHKLTGWGNWLYTNLQPPTGNPCGQEL